MRHQDSSVPDWINKWLIFNALALVINGLFCMLRPRSLPGGDLDFLFPGHALYVKGDLQYTDMNDNFVLVEGIANLFIEFPLCLIAIFYIFRLQIRGLKVFIIVSSVMTFYKSLLYLLYAMDLHVGGHAVKQLALEIFGFLV